MKLLKKARREYSNLVQRLPKNKHRNARELKVTMVDIHLLPALAYEHEREIDFIRITLPTQILIMNRGIDFTVDANPFMQALERGVGALEKFYANFQPKNLQEMYELPRRGLKGEELHQFAVPWAANDKGSLTKGEAGLSADHGLSHFGPVSQAKIDKEMERLIETKASIESQGFAPEKFGDIKGYFLRDGDVIRFEVAGGKHRAAVLAHLGWKDVPVRMRPGWARFINRRDVDDWPRVLSGQMDRQLALDVFDRAIGRRYDLGDAKTG